MSNLTDPITLDFPTDLDAWPQSYVDFQTAQVEAASPELAPVITPSAPTIAPAVPVEFSIPGNQQAGANRVTW